MDTRDPGGPRPGPTEPAGLSPVRAFLVVGALATVLGVVFFATREATPSEPPAPARSPDYSLTDDEAIARFAELHDVFRSASIKRDESLLSVMLTTDSPLERTARAQIRQLVRDGVVDRSRFRQERVDVVLNSPTRIELEQVVTIRPRFLSTATHKPVSTGPSLRQEVRWTLALEDTVWKVYDSQVVASRRLR